MQKLLRRGFDLGPVPIPQRAEADPINNWAEGKPVYLPKDCLTMIEQETANIAKTERFVLQILEGENTDELLDQPPYVKRLQSDFALMGSAYNQGDDQEIEMVMFDALGPRGSAEEPIAEDLWMKVSWLSYHDDDASLRFRFSFGVDLAEDVAADPTRQQAAARLASAIFPESTIITDNEQLREKIVAASGKSEPQFVERIVYFNAPMGGAYLHHDLERGHAGVVYAQVTGSTVWLALPYFELANCVKNFIQSEPYPDSLSASQMNALDQLVLDDEQLAQALNSFAHDALIHLLNETQEFVQFLIARDHYRVLNAGDVLLLPQKDAQQCCWHSVFCLGDEIGQALSFAIR